jgi:hypothetical protein
MAAFVLKADAVFEAALAVVLAGCASLGLLGSDDFPAPVNGAVIAAVAVALVPVAFVLWRLGRRTRVPRASLEMIAAANTATAVLATAWLLAADGFSASGTAVAGATAALLACLAAVQLTAARNA